MPRLPQRNRLALAVKAMRRRFNIIVTAGLQLWHNYSEDTLDKSTNSNHGVMHTGRSLAFDGSNDYVSTDAVPNKTEGTFSTWFKIDTHKNYNTIFDNSAGADVWECWVYATGQIKFRVSGGVGDVTYDNLAENTWYRLAITWSEANGTKLYINNSTPSTGGSGTFTAPGTLSLGGEFNSKLNGEMSNVQIWDKAWTAYDVAYDYANVQATPNDIANNNSALSVANCRTWLPMTEGAGFTLYDGGVVLGDELVANGTFDGVADGTDVSTLTDWYAYGTATSINVNNEELVVVTTSSTQGSRYNVTTVVGNTYKFSATVSGDLGSTGIYINNISDVSTVGGEPDYTFTAVSTTTMIFFRAASNGAGTTTYDNISVKEVQPKENGGITPADATGATWQTARVGQPSPKEMITNGGFDTSIALGSNGSGWNPITQGDCTVEYANGGVKLTQASVGNEDCKIYAETLGGSTSILTSGQKYSVTYEVTSNNGSDNLLFYVGGSYTSVPYSVGSHTVTYTQGVNTLSLFWNGTASSDITLDNISIKDVTNGIPQTGLMSYNKPMLFDGVNDAVETEIMNPMAEFTISASFDIKHNASNAYSALIDGGWWGVAPKFWVNIVNNNLFVEGFKTGSSTRWTLREDNVSDGLHHFSATYSSSALKLYLDGVEVDSIAGQSLTSISTVSPIQIGSMSISPSSNSFDGYINEVSIFDTALTADEVSELYNNGTALDATTHSKVDNLQGYWRNDGDDVWVDRSGNNNDGTVNGSPESILLPEARNGRDTLGFPINNVNNGYLALHGDGYVEVADDASLDITSEMTVELWADKHTNLSEYTMGKWVGAQRSWFVHIRSYSLQFSWTEDGEWATNKGYLISTDSNSYAWNHYVIIFNNGAVKLYQNGELKGTQSTHANSTIYNSTSPVTIGRGYSAYDPINGSIDEPRIYNRALTEAEVLQNYNAGKSKHRND